MVDAVARAARPCGECPWRLDTPPGQFSAARYAALANTSPGPTPRVVGPAAAAAVARQWIDAPLFACHKSPEGSEWACAGWLASGAADHHLGVRVAVATGRLDRAALRPGPGWPALFGDFEEMAARQAAAPPPEGCADGQGVRACRPQVCPRCGHRHVEGARCAGHVWDDSCAYDAGADCPGQGLRPVVPVEVCCCGGHRRPHPRGAGRCLR